jgi:hypothetical protein
VSPRRDRGGERFVFGHRIESIGCLRRKFLPRT